MSKRFLVTVHEVWHQTFVIEAGSPERARQLVAQGMGAQDARGRLPDVPAYPTMAP